MQLVQMGSGGGKGRGSVSVNILVFITGLLYIINSVVFSYLMVGWVLVSESVGYDGFNT